MTLKILNLHPELNLQPWHLQEGSCVIGQQAITKKIKSNSKGQMRFAYRPRLRSLNLAGVQRATARDHRPSAGNIIGAPSLSARSYAFWRMERAPASFCFLARPRQLVYRFVDVRQSRRTFGRKEASFALSAAARST